MGIGVLMSEFWGRFLKTMALCWKIKLQIDYQNEAPTISEATGVISVQHTLYWLEKGYVGFIFLTESLVLRPDYGQ